MTEDVVVLCWQMPRASEINALKIAEFSGANVRYISLASSTSHASIREFLPACVCLIVHVQTLVKIADFFGVGADGLLALTQLAEHIFIFGFQSTGRHSLILQTLSSHGLVGLELTPAGDAQFHVAEGQPACGQFSGLSFGTVNAKRDRSFLQSAERSHLTVVIRGGDRPFLVRTRHGSADVLFSACAELADLDETVPFDASPLSWFSRVVPLMMFLRAALRERLWHSDTPRACFIIDDPLLRNRYGFLDYSKLSEAMSGQKFSLCVAFIPWNFRRSQGRVRELFSGHPGSYSVCIHGCDHTAAEFESDNFESVSAKACLALERMRAHQTLTGIPFHEVMVFPQGLFTSEALYALNACGYLAAVNTHLCPSNTHSTLTLRDLLDVAMTRFDFPLFGRRYPRDVAAFAFDLFLGKPAFVVEHHQYFRNGYGALEAFVAKLNALDERLEWADLTTNCSRACLVKRIDASDFHVRFYTNRFQLENAGPERKNYVLFRKYKGGGDHPP